MIDNYKCIETMDNPDWTAMESIKIEDNLETLVPTSLSSRIRHYPVYNKMGVEGSISECFVRETVFEKLHQAAKALPQGTHLVVLDGWRPYCVQQYLYEALLKELKLSPEHRGKSLDSLQLLARNIVSPAKTNPLCPSPHLTGGAVDVTLCDDLGRLLNMGTLFDENHPLSWTAAIERCEHIEQQVIANRRMLYHAMTSAGFANLPSEWWHYGYGDQIWAFYNKQPVAIYGATKPIDLVTLWKTPSQ